MKRKKIIIITIILIILIIFLLFILNSYLKSIKDNENLVQNITTNTGNSNILTNENPENKESLNINNEIASNLENRNEGGEESMRLNIKVGDKNFKAILESNNTTKSLLEKLPLTINMSELHGNEKYYYFDESLPTNSERIGNINTGDLMIYGSDCLVLFYKSFSTSYSYTRLGHIDNPQVLADAVGNENITVTFEVAN
mgnify:CR=1 FL=1